MKQVLLNRLWFLSASVLLVVLFAVAKAVWFVSPQETLERKVNAAEKQLQEALRREPRYSNVTALGWAQLGGLIQCSGCVDSTNDLEALNRMFERFSSTNLPITNTVEVWPSPETRPHK